jgi:hypothetical protein
MSFNHELMVNTAENAAFWKEVENNFVQSYLFDTDNNYDFKIPCWVLKSYFQCVAYLNKDGLC